MCIWTFTCHGIYDIKNERCKLRVFFSLSSCVFFLFFAERPICENSLMVFDSNRIFRLSETKIKMSLEFYIVNVNSDNNICYRSTENIKFV